MPNDKTAANFAGWAGMKTRDPLCRIGAHKLTRHLIGRSVYPESAVFTEISGDHSGRKHFITVQE
ncbi:hypothetical protein ACWF9G_24860 [Nocardia sp. NPDC055029]